MPNEKKSLSRRSVFRHAALAGGLGLLLLFFLLESWLLNRVSPAFALRSAAVAGVGVVKLPAMFIQEELSDGSLVNVSQDWALNREIIHAVYPSRRGMLPSVRALIDFLSERYGELDEN